MKTHRPSPVFETGRLATLVITFCILSQSVLAIDFPNDVLRREFTLPETGNEVWIYLPADYEGKQFPCVLIAPAGSRLFHGQPLGDSDWMEHLPYVRAGFAVVAYELSGTLPEDPDDEEMRAAIGEFVNVKGGVTDAAAALSFAASRVPAIDTNRLYVAGHSSAATTALAIARASDRVKGVVAYAPPLDLKEALADALPGLNKLHPGFDQFLASFSPSENASQLKTPLLLFYAKDDRLMDESVIADFWEELKQQGTPAAIARAEMGGHYLSMIKEGIPLGIDWLKRIDSGESLDGFSIPESMEIPSFSSEPGGAREYFGDEIQVRLEEGFELIREDSEAGDAFTIQWSEAGGGMIGFHQLASADGTSLQEFAKGLIENGTLGELAGKTVSLDPENLEPCDFNRGIFRGVSSVSHEAVSPEGSWEKHFFLTDGTHHWYVSAATPEEEQETVHDLIQDFRSVSLEKVSWNRIYEVGFDPPLHRVGNAPAEGGTTSPEKNDKGDPFVRSSLGKMRGPLLEFEITESTPLANPRAGSGLRYDEINFSLPRGKDVYRLRCQLYFESPEEGRRREDFVIFFEIVGAESVTFRKDGYVTASRLGGDYDDRLPYPDNELITLDTILHAREGWVEIKVDGEILLSKPFERGSLRPRELRLSYGGSTPGTTRVGVDNIFVDVGGPAEDPE